MQLKWGAYEFAAGAVDLRASAETVMNRGGQPERLRRRLDVEGNLDGDGQAAISVACSALATALARPYQDLIFCRDDGSPTDTALYNARSITGVVIKNLEFPGKPGDYATTRKFRFTAEADYPIANTANLLVSFSERLRFSGGGPIKRHKMALNEKPQRQTIFRYSIYKVSQEGEAVGLYKRPSPPPPIWPDDLMEAPEVDKVSPERQGRLYTDFAISWRYMFESANPFVGEPNLWKG